MIADLKLQLKLKLNYCLEMLGRDKVQLKNEKKKDNPEIISSHEVQ